MRGNLADIARTALRGVQASRCDFSRGFAASAETSIEGKNLHTKQLPTSSLCQHCVLDTIASCCAGTPPKHESPKKKRVSEEDRVGAKSKLYSILKQSTQPLSSADIWDMAEVTAGTQLASHFTSPLPWRKAGFTCRAWSWQTGAHQHGQAAHALTSFPPLAQLTCSAVKAPPGIMIFCACSPWELRARAS